MNALHSENLGGRCGRLAVAMLAGWMVALIPAVKLFGVDGFAALSFSAIVCYVPGCLIFWGIAGTTQAGAQIRAVVLGTLLRMAFALGGAWVMHGALAIAPRNYLVWLGLFYLISLAVETCLVMPRGRPARSA